MFERGDRTDRNRKTLVVPASAAVSTKYLGWGMCDRTKTLTISGCSTIAFSEPGFPTLNYRFSFEFNESSFVSSRLISKT